ncbi:MAG TPA: thiol:disulfide interchange protein DsbA/DsbL [Gammaproteobacteria bacterium]|nr:thiol:disulfide interchange protein DsbA/DsbL [Gammaproteobacteria bacterium]
MRKILTSFLMLLFVSPVFAAPKFTQDVNYFALSKAQPTVTGNKIEVRELFWYGCPHCYRMEPLFEKWLSNKPANVEFIRTPAVLRNSWAFDARVYYTFKELNLVDKLHRPFFDSIHKERKRIRNAEQLADFAAEHGIDRQAVLDAFNSFSVDSNTRRARVLSENYETNGVPTVIIGGKYRSSAASAGSYVKLIEIIDFLVKKVASETK